MLPHVAHISPWNFIRGNCGTSATTPFVPTPSGITRRRENMVGVNMVGVSIVVHDAICECFEGIVLEPCLLQPCVHVAGLRFSLHTARYSLHWVHRSLRSVDTTWPIAEQEAICSREFARDGSFPAWAGFCPRKLKELPCRSGSGFLVFVGSKEMFE